MIGFWNDGILVLELTEKYAEPPINWLNARIRAQTGREDAVFPAEILPPTGLIAFRRHPSGKEILCGAAYLYLERNTSIAVCGHLVTSGRNTPFESMRAAKSLVAEMPGYAKTLGAKHLLTTFGNRRINDYLDSQGFVTGDRTVEHKYKLL